MSNRHHSARCGLLIGALASLLAACSEEPESVSHDLHGADAVALTCIEGDVGFPVAHCAEADSLGSLYAFVASVAHGHLAVLRLTGRNSAGAVTSRPGLEDASRSIPMITPLRVGDAPVRVVVAPDGRYLFTLNNGSRDITVVRVGDRCVVGRLSWAELPEAIPPAVDLLPGLRWWLAAGDGDAPRELLFSLPGAGALGRFDLDACGLNDETACVPPGAEVPASDCSPELAFGAALSPLSDGRRPSPGWLTWTPRDGAVANAEDAPGDPSEAYALLVADARFDQLYLLDPVSGERLGDPLQVSPECSNGLDDDGDGLTDLGDAGCSWSGDSSEGGGASPPQCANGEDDDGDSLIDLDDPGCSSAGDPREDGPYEAPQCDDGVDNDGDELVDLDDPGCEALWDGDEQVPAVNLGPCADGQDNDGDELVDGSDPDCVEEEEDEADPPLQPLPPRTAASCANGLDDDADGLIDGDDPGCAHLEDDDEGDDRESACNNGEDDDGDELADLDDPGCAAAGDDEEGDPDDPPACLNGIDDDGDGLADYPDDPGCLAPGWGEERQPFRAPGCANGIDDDGDSLADYPEDPDCPCAGADSEHAAPLPCANGLDDDEDGLIDLADPDCLLGETGAEDGAGLRLRAGCTAPEGADAAWVETACAVDADGDLLSTPLAPRALPRCANSRDDDGDSLVDAEDPGCSGPLDDDEVEPTEAVACVDWSKDSDICSYAGTDQDAPKGPAACDDGLDNDGDGRLDPPPPGGWWARRAGCTTPSGTGGRCTSAPTAYTTA